MREKIKAIYFFKNLLVNCPTLLDFYSSFFFLRKPWTGLASISLASTQRIGIIILKAFEANDSSTLGKVEQLVLCMQACLFSFRRIFNPILLKLIHSINFVLFDSPRKKKHSYAIEYPTVGRPSAIIGR